MIINFIDLSFSLSLSAGVILTSDVIESFGEEVRKKLLFDQSDLLLESVVIKFANRKIFTHFTCSVRQPEICTGKAGEEEKDKILLWEVIKFNSMNKLL